MYLSNQDLKSDYLKYLNICPVFNLEEYIIDNKLDYASFFYCAVRNNHCAKMLQNIRSEKYNYYYIKYIKDNLSSRKIINDSNCIKYKSLLCVLDKQISSVDIENSLIKSKNVNLIINVYTNCKVFNKKLYEDFLLKTNTAKSIFAVANKSKTNLQKYADLLIKHHKKTYIFAFMKKHKNLDFSRYEEFLIKNNLIKEIKKFLTIKTSEKLQNFLILT